MPRLVPAAKNRSKPLCRNPLIATELSVTYAVTDHNPVNIHMEPTRPTVRVIMGPRRAAHLRRWADKEQSECLSDSRQRSR